MPLPMGRAYGVWAGNVNFQPGDYILRAYDSVTASTTQTQAGGTLLTAELNAVASVNAADAVRLPKAHRGMVVTVLLTTATTTCTVFPDTGDSINAIAANSGIVMAGLTRAQFCCATNSKWYTLPLLPS